MGLPCQRHQGHSSTQRQLIQCWCCLLALLLYFPYFLSLYCKVVNLHSCKDFKNAWKEEEQVPRDLLNNACAWASSLFKHRQAYQKGWMGLFSLSVPGSAPVGLHRVNLSPFKQKSSENRSSCICEVWRNLGKKAKKNPPQVSSTPDKLF